jgi:iron(II)-dependent oxidoreductase
MVEGAFKTIAPEVGAQQAVADLEQVRARTLKLIEHLGADELERLHSPIMSPLAWDLAHIAAYEDLWLAHRHAHEPLLRPDLAETYDAFETPRALRGEVRLLDAEASFAYMAQVRERVIALSRRDGVGDGTLHEMVLRHELQHTETKLQTMSLADLLPPSWDAPVSLRHPLPPSRDAGLEQHQGEASDRSMQDLGTQDPRRQDRGTLNLGAQDPRWIDFDACCFQLGARPDGFAYDNERDRHPVQLAAFRIARLPVSNGEWRQFQEQGGYQRKELWSPQGWTWLQDAEPALDRRTGTGAEHDPVCHVSFHEAEAFAASQDARLPTEAEWERAARDEQQPLAGVGSVWEWTSSEFSAYPGFVAHPYREYSEVFFDRGYKVLRGGSWATDERVTSNTFRNWDLPQRRQIFAGVRLATDL